MVPEMDKSIAQEDSVKLKADYLTQIQVIRSCVVALKERLLPLCQRLVSAEKGEEAEHSSLPTHQGISLLDVKCHTLLSYCIHLLGFCMEKLLGVEQGGEGAEGSTSAALIEHRIVLEKINPIQSKLKYQIDKLLKAATASTTTSIKTHSNSGASILGNVLSDPLQFKPNPANLAMLGDGAGDSDTEHGRHNASGVYRPPRVAPMPYTGETKDSSESALPSTSSVAAKKAILSARVKERASQSRLLRDLAMEYDIRPEESSASGAGFGSRDVGALVGGVGDEDERWKEREAFEEDNFVRLNLTREDKKLKNRLEKRGGMTRFANEFADLETDFGRLSGVSEAVDREARFARKSGELLAKRDSFKDTIRRGDGSKRKFQDAGELVTQLSRAKRNQASSSSSSPSTTNTTDAFSRDVKRVKIGLQKADARMKKKKRNQSAMKK